MFRSVLTSLAVVLVASLAGLVPSWARAGTDGLAMHGAAAHPSGFEHFPYADPAAPKGGRLREAVLGGFDSLNRVGIRGRLAAGLTLLHDPLMARAWDEPFSLYPLVAERVELPSDRSAITFHLDPRARFHDGTPITVEDVIWTFETLRAVGRPATRATYGLVAAVERVPPRGVRFVMGPGANRETPLILALMTPLPRGDWAPGALSDLRITPPLGSGPYRIAEVEPGRRITYERVPDWWARDLPVARGHYNFGRITYEYFRDDTVAFEAFKAGQVDLRRETDAVRWAVGYAFPAVRRGQVRLLEAPHGRPEPARGFAFNLRRTPLDDVRVRRALALTFEADWVNATLFHGRFRRSASLFPNSDLAAAELALPDLRPRRARLAEALDLVAAAGWRMEAGRLTRDGEMLSLELLVQDQADERLALEFARGVARLGGVVRVRLMDAAQARQRLDSYQFDLVLTQWVSTLSPGNEQRNYWGSAAATKPGGRNLTGLADPIIDGAIDRLTGTIDRDSFVMAAQDLDRAVAARVPFVPLFHPGIDRIAHWPTVAGPDTFPVYGPILETWWSVPAADQAAAAP